MLLTLFSSNSKVPETVIFLHYEKEEPMKTALIFFFAVLSEVIASTSLKFSMDLPNFFPA